MCRWRHGMETLSASLALCKLKTKNIKLSITGPCWGLSTMHNILSINIVMYILHTMPYVIPRHPTNRYMSIQVSGVSQYSGYPLAFCYHCTVNWNRLHKLNLIFSCTDFSKCDISWSKYFKHYFLINLLLPRRLEGHPNWSQHVCRMNILGRINNFSHITLAIFLRVNGKDEYAIYVTCSCC